ncbi:MAG: undecaprenyldiphospho-muramoylpentapeptide beta-N-acetylglucosaminyltransferase [Pseudomonadota bacterium]|jgi:UDP-N-acetylglucosamine--N-acetylmuramyl-(pentapeptide) pyrophosphoryl-undecaprenol N-acetylglucosamine transferase
MARILIAAGGTGGHVYPGLAVAQYLLAAGHQVHWLGTRRGLEARVIPEAGIPMHWLQVNGLRGKGWGQRLLAPWMLLRALWSAWRILRAVRPDVVLGMGGFVAGPAGVAAWLCRIPLVVHEQNRIPGTTNRWLARIATRVLEGFPGSFPSQVGAHATGNPLRAGWQQRSAARAPDAGMRLLIVGGSLGAQWLNEHVPVALAALGRPFSIRHQTGAAMLDETRQRYATLGMEEAEVCAYIDDMQAAYEAADLVLCRSGAMTVSELAASGVPSVLVPYPHAIDDHQWHNACYLAEAGAALVERQGTLTAERLAEAVAELLDDAGRLRAMSLAARALARDDATREVATICLEVTAS